MEKQSPAWLRPTIEYGPLGVFLIAYYKFDLIAATGAFMVATVVALAASYIFERRVPIVLVVTAVIVMVFGGLTLIFDDDRFIKMKPTIVQALFAVVLLDGATLGGPSLALPATMLPDAPCIESLPAPGAVPPTRATVSPVARKGLGRPSNQARVQRKRTALTR